MPLAGGVVGYTPFAQQVRMAVLEDGYLAHRLFPRSQHGAGLVSRGCAEAGGIDRGQQAQDP
jgi:hypothetical protein